MAAIEQVLSRLDRWLSENAPVTAQTLRPPAAAADIDRLEASLGFPLHHDVRGLLSWHDGAEPTEDVGAFEVLPSFRLLASSEILEVRDQRRRADPDNLAWTHFLVPVGDDDASANLVVDHGPRHGCFISEPEEGSEPIYRWASLEAALQAAIASLTDRSELMQSTPNVVDNVLTWT